MTHTRIDEPHDVARRKDDGPVIAGAPTMVGEQRGVSRARRNAIFGSATTSTIRIGTRGSLLALTQAATVRDALIVAGHDAELVVVSTAGDRSSQPVDKIGVGVFTGALRDELARGTVDVAVHSYKDLPTAPDERFVIAAVPSRGDPRDALVARDGLRLRALPAAARVGTSAPRRAAQLRALGLGLDVVALRGNLDTRLAKVSAGELDAVVVAAAGLVRIGRIGAATELLSPEVMLPAPGQGALAVECRGVDAELVAVVRKLDDAPTHAAVIAERALLAEMEAGCTAPVGAMAELGDGRLVIRGCAAALDGSDVFHARAVGFPAQAEELGRLVARDLLGRGAAALMSTREEVDADE